ncbi:MAG: DUF721 domain-containing protein [Microscillaceae bacterium]|nr:DUF721 domain-containing protein [Microscillaceae bacterium]
MNPKIKNYDPHLESRSQWRKADSRKADEVVSDWVEVYQLHAKFGEVEILKLWGEIAHPVVARRTARVFLKNDSLFVKLESSALKKRAFDAKNHPFSTIK